METPDRLTARPGDPAEHARDRTARDEPVRHRAHHVRGHPDRLAGEEVDEQLLDARVRLADRVDQTEGDDCLGRPLDRVHPPLRLHEPGHRGPRAQRHGSRTSANLLPSSRGSGSPTGRRLTGTIVVTSSASPPWSTTYADSAPDTAPTRTSFTVASASRAIRLTSATGSGRRPHRPLVDAGLPGQRGRGVRPQQELVGDQGRLLGEEHGVPHEGRAQAARHPGDEPLVVPHPEGQPRSLSGPGADPPAIRGRARPRTRR